MNRENWLFLAVLCFVLSDCITFFEHDDSDPPHGHSGMGIKRDELTGCEYLTRGALFGAAITPRMDKDGKQICRPRP